ncbi:RNA polymerase sigma-70 factor [Puia sp. P3]|uniref:RNA polymerase sigma-70 factor n=1 Tax=Puia sp. P3 TaxID=3423952 RepID=UPI003D67B82F
MASQKDKAIVSFEDLFRTYFQSLYAYAFLTVRDGKVAEEIVQQVFCRLWEKWSSIAVHTSFNAYLYKAVHNECLQHQRRKKHQSRYQSHMVWQEKHARTGDPSSERLQQKELERRFYQALEQLPGQCRLVFQLHRFTGMKYPEIAHQLNISLKTVESQMAKALKRLRQSLAEFLPLLILFLWHK